MLPTSAAHQSYESLAAWWQTSLESGGIDIRPDLKRTEATKRDELYDTAVRDAEQVRRLCQVVEVGMID